MRSTLLALLLIAGSCLSSCTPAPRTGPDVSWVKPIVFHKATVDYLAALKDAPPELYIDLGQVWLHNKKCQDILGK